MDQNRFDAALAQEISKYYDDPVGFVMFCYPWGEKGTPLEPWPEGPDEWQKRFLQTWGEGIKRRGFDGVKAVTPIQISVASGHGIGKSALTSWIIHFIMSTRPMAKGVVTAGKYAQLKDKTWAELAKWKKMAINGHWFEYHNSQGNLSYYHKDHKESWVVNGQAATKENADSFAGLHNAQSTPFYIFDEASAVPSEIYEVAMGGLTDGEPFMFLFGNPTRSTGYFADTFGKNRHRWINWHVDSRTARMTNKELINEWVADYGEDSDFVRVRVKGQFPRVGDSQFISTEAVEMAMEREVEPNAADPIVIGVDVARFGDDQSCIAVRHGRKLLEIRTFRELDLMSFSNKVIEAIDAYKPHTVFVDGAGIGAGVIDRLRQLSYRCIEVQAGSRPFDPDKFTNLRAEMWWKLREWVEYADLPEDDQELLYDLTGIEYGYDERMRVKLEKKSDMKKRGLPSPDCFIAGTMVLTPRGEYPIEELSIGDMVVTPRGPVPIFAIHKSLADSIATVRFSNGRSLTGKPAHKIFTWDSGWVALGDLTKYNVIESASPWRLLVWQSLQKWFTPTSRFTFKQHVDTISPDGRMSLNDFFTVESGRTPMARFQSRIASIILTVIGQTMSFLTSSVFTTRSMDEHTCSNGLKTLSMLREICLAWRKLRRPLKNGTPPRKGFSGIPSMENKRGKDGSPLTPYVNTAGQPIRHSSPPDQSSVQLNAGVTPLIIAADIIPTSESALGAEPATPEAVIEKPNAVPEPVPTGLEAQGNVVYNLTLETENVYYANGILVQNCADALSLTFAENVNPVSRPRGARRKNKINWRTM